MLNEEIKTFFIETVLANPFLEFLCFFLAAMICIGILVWFFAFSGYGSLPEFVYSQF